MNISKEETVASVFCVFSARCFGFDSLCESKESAFERALFIEERELTEVMYRK